MSVRVTVDLPEELAQRARAAAVQSRRPFEEVLVEWIDRAAPEMLVDSLPDADVIALCDAEIDSSQQEELSELLARNRENSLQVGDRARLDSLMHIYRRGLIRKAQARRTAVSRGLVHSIP
jgi:hypothetical protein